CNAHVALDLSFNSFVSIPTSSLASCGLHNLYWVLLEEHLNLNTVAGVRIYHLVNLTYIPQE
ncbi:MAG: hypothetical protein WCF07_01540, partial [Nitrososphaeraceae archaeon]